MSEHRNNNHHCRQQTTLLRKCRCGKYHLHYKYAMLTIPQQTLFSIMKECYEWEAMRSSCPEIFHDKSLKLMVGVIVLTISGKDFDEFNAAIQQGASEALNIVELVGNPSRD
ncbi:MAG: hypothetical protein MI684_10010 [Chlorobiales bacterium]|nr:hypothetical protein [Chlorobiales bacterium]